MAGSVTDRKKERSTVSDWLEIERKRGISVSSTVLYFDYDGYRINLLDTPGHNDFSEDTYRVLMAVDSVIMVVDAGKGIEKQTKKLFEVCRKRHIPVFTFINKLDRPTLDTLALLDEIESVLNIAAYPMNWPLGNGPEFKGVWDRRTNLAHMFERTVGGSYIAPVSTCGIEDPVIQKALTAQTYETLKEEIEMIEGAGAEFDVDDIAHGRTTPVFFGSAINNFGLELLLNCFVEFAPGPQPRKARDMVVDPEDPFFSAFVFKIQANMDPRHRDRMVFIRIVSGKFTKDMAVTHVRTGKKVRLSSASSVFGRERETIEEAYPGDVIGIVGGDFFGIGDTLTENPKVNYAEIPRFAPECFSYLHNPVPANYKKFSRGVEQLIQEGLVHQFTLAGSAQLTYMLGAIGTHPFDMVQYRLESEYSAPSRMEPAPWTIAQWIVGGWKAGDPIHLSLNNTLALDRDDNHVVLFATDWHQKMFQDKNKDIVLSDCAPQ